MIVLSILIIVAELTLMIAATYQDPEKLSYVFAGEQTLVFLLICVGCFFGGAAINISSVTANIFGHAFKLSNPEDLHQLYRHQHKFSCCGAWGPQDWLRYKFFEWEDIAMTATGYMENRMNWVHRCHKNSSQICTMPRSCCKGRAACYIEFSGLEFNEITKAEERNDTHKIDELMQLFKHNKLVTMQLLRA